MVWIRSGIAMSKDQWSAKDQLAPTAPTPGPSREAEYDAVYAAVTATERGRWFLNEYANRSRQTDTHLIIAGIARIEAAVGGDAAPRASAALWRDLTAIAAIIERLRSGLAAEAAAAPIISGAVERIQDVAFGLRDRAVDAALCDSLDAAARDISAARVSAAGGHAAEALRDLARRIDRLIKLAPSRETPNQIVSPVADGEPVPSPAPLAAAGPSTTPAVQEDAAIPADVNEALPDPDFDTKARENKKVTDAVAMLALSLTSSFGAAADSPSSAARRVVEPAAHSQAAETEAETAAVTQAHADDAPRWSIESPDFVFRAADRESRSGALHAKVQRPPVEALLPEAQLRSAPPDKPSAPAVLATSPARVSPAPFARPLDDQRASAEVPAPPRRVASGMSTSMMPLSATPMSTVPMSAVPINIAVRPPLAALRSLTEDELTALFG